MLPRSALAIVLALGLSLPVFAQVAKVIGGRVVDTGRKADDNGIMGATVELLDAKENAIVPARLTDQRGQYFFDKLPAITGKVNVRVTMGGFSRKPHLQEASVAPTNGTQMALQEDVRLTRVSDFSKGYLQMVAENAAAEISGKPSLATVYAGTFADLPAANRVKILDGVRTANSKAYADLSKANQEFVQAEKLEQAIRAFSPDVKVYPNYGTSGKVRLYGTVPAEKDVDAILRKANDQGNWSGRIVNDIHVAPASQR